jgi:hypothetical protein
VLPHFQNKLEKIQRYPQPIDFPLGPATVLKHEAFLASTKSLHDYSCHDPVLTRLAEATWPSSLTLHCVRSTDIRSLFFGDHSAVSHRISSWNSIPYFSASDYSKWTQIWGFHRDSKELYLLWKILYQVNATQKWRKKLEDDPITTEEYDPDLHCVCCFNFCIEDECHLFWECHFSNKIWRWVFYIVSLRTGDPWTPGIHHALLGNPVPHHLKGIQHWWDLFRGSILWQLWLNRNARVFCSPDSTLLQSTVACTGLG